MSDTPEFRDDLIRRRNALMNDTPEFRDDRIRRRKENFNFSIKPAQTPFGPGEASLEFTHNGHQFTRVNFLPEEGIRIAEALLRYFKATQLKFPAAKIGVLRSAEYSNAQPQTFTGSDVTEVNRKVYLKWVRVWWVLEGLSDTPPEADASDDDVARFVAEYFKAVPAESFRIVSADRFKNDDTGNSA